MIELQLDSRRLELFEELVDPSKVEKRLSEVMYDGMVHIQLDFLDVEEFEEFSDDIVHSGAEPETVMADVKIIQPDGKFSIFGVELFRVEETANWTIMRVDLYGYYKEPEE